MTTPLGKPPCGSCTLCCKGWQAVAFFPELGDDPAQYEVTFAGDVMLLAFKENGDCFYLGENGCTIHDRAPVVCREFDCRGLFLQLTRIERRRMTKAGNMKADIFEQGRKLAPTLDDEGVKHIARHERGRLGRHMLDSTKRMDTAMGKNKKGMVANIAVKKDD